MLKIAVIASLLAVSFAQYRYPDEGYGGGHGHEDYSQPIPFKFGYDIVGGDHHSGDFKQTRQETGDGHGNVQGSYSYQDAHGNHRVVNYVADHHGFRAQVRTNEPGTESQSPADVEFHSDAPRIHGDVHTNRLGHHSLY